jgi:glycosyltransferase involved in cell wall biosynthesis
MKVLLIHQAFASIREAGGTRHYELALRLARRGDRMTIVTSQILYGDARPVRPDRGGLYYREEHEGLVVLRAYAPRSHHRSYFQRAVAFGVFAATSLWAGLRAGPTDLVMGTTPPAFQAVSAWLIARLRRKPFLLEVRDLWTEFAIDMGILRNPVAKALARRLERFLYRRADHFLVNSPAYREYLVKQGIPRERISFVANGVDVAMFDPTAVGATVRERFGVQDKFLVVYAGSQGPANDLRTLLRCADRLRDDPSIQVLLFGDGKERPSLQREAQDLGLSNVTFAEWVPKAQVPEILAAADVCVASLMNIPMFTTTYPNKVFDYMAAGRPTILAIDGVIREVVEASGGGIFVPPGDPVAMAEAVRRLRRDPALRAEMGRAARAFVAANFDRDAQAEEFREVLHRMVECEA